MLREGKRFLVASVAATLLQYALLVFLVEVVTLAALASGALAFVAGAVTNYVLRRNYVFRRDTPHRQGIPRAAVVTLMGLGMNMAIFWIALDGLGLPYLLAQAAATGMLFAWNFLAHRHWTFAPARGRLLQPAALLSGAHLLRRRLNELRFDRPG